MNTRHLPLLAAALGIAGCNPAGSWTQYPTQQAQAQYAAQAAEYDRQLKTGEEQMKRTEEQLALSEQQAKRVDEQLDVSEKQAKRMEALFEKWDEQARRYDAILTRWEQQPAPPPQPQ